VSTRPLLCATVTASTTAELRRRRDAVVDADLVELRLDTVSDPDVPAALADRRRPVIVTCRAGWEGGQFAGSEEERHRLLREALALGAEYVDLEWKARFDDLLAESGGRRIVLSFHDFNGVPGDLGAIAAAMSATGAEVIKIAAQAHRLGDCLPLLSLAKTADPARKKVLIAMGEAGLSSRVLAARFGSAWSYAGELRGAGQVTPASLLGDYRYRSLSCETDLYGLVGSPISHSVSPAMHNAAFDAADIDAVYLPLPAADPDDFLTFAGAFGLKGVSVTIPYKVPLLDRLDEVDQLARHVGAVNTVRIQDGRWLGRNTDVQGFLAPLHQLGIELRGLRASIVGAGGSARAVAVALASRDAAVSVHAREPARAAAVAELVSGRAGEWPPAPGSWDLLINCTPVGMHPHLDDMPVPVTTLTGRYVYDLIYNPPATRLLVQAALAGCDTIGGLDMLVGQAQAQFEWWTGMPASAGVMRSAAENRLLEFSTP
jgi:3-dehydroquinate dehydratase/shikimate dehydrogenase